MGKRFFGKVRKFWLCTDGSRRVPGGPPLTEFVTKLHFSTFPTPFFFPTIMSFFTSILLGKLLFSFFWQLFPPIDFWQWRRDDENFLTLPTPLNSCPAHLLGCGRIFFTPIPSSYSRFKIINSSACPLLLGRKGFFPDRLLKVKEGRWKLFDVTYPP
jgi:hypothetical protein